MDEAIGSVVDDVDNDDIGSVDGGFNGFGAENVGENAPSLILLHLSLYPSSFRLFDGIIDGLDVLEIEFDENDDAGDANDGFNPFPSICDDLLSSHLLYLLLLLNLILFIVFGDEMDGGYNLDVGGINDGLFGDFGDILVEWGWFDDDVSISSNSSLSLSLSLLFIDKFDWINGGVMVFVFGDDNDDMIGDFGVDLVGFGGERNGGDPSPILLSPILLFLL